MKLLNKIKLILGIVVISGLFIGSIVLYNNITKPKMDDTIIENSNEYKSTLESQQEFVGEVKSKLSGELIVSRNERNIIHKTTFTQDIPVNMHGETIKAKAIIVKYGSATIQYNYITNLNKAKVEQEGNTITIKLQKPYLDEDSVKIKNGTFKLDKNKSSISVAAKMVISKELLNNVSETSDGKSTRLLMEEIPKEAIKQIKKDSSNFIVNDELIENINNKIKDVTANGNLIIKVVYE